MAFRQFLVLQCAAFVFFGLALMLVPGPFLEGVYQMDGAGDVGWIRLFGATLLGVGAMEWAMIQELERYSGLAPAFIAVPALLTVAILWVLIQGTEVFNAFFGWSSLGITTFFTLGHLYFRREAQSALAT